MILVDVVDAPLPGIARAVIRKHISNSAAVGQFPNKGDLVSFGLPVSDAVRRKIRDCGIVQPHDRELLVRLIPRDVNPRFVIRLAVRAGLA